MSRIGKNPVVLKGDVSAELKENNLFFSKGSNKFDLQIPANIDVEIAENQVVFTPKNKDKQTRALWGTVRSLADNIVVGLTDGFTKTLDIVGVGYRASMSGKQLKLQLGFSHDVLLDVPEGLDVKCTKPTQIIVTGSNKQLVGSFAAKIRSFRKPEPYKGKGVKYSDEYILRKEAKKK